MPVFSLFAILGVAWLRLRLRNRCGLGLNRNPPFLDGQIKVGSAKLEGGINYAQNKSGACRGGRHFYFKTLRRLMKLLRSKPRVLKKDSISVESQRTEV